MSGESKPGTSVTQASMDDLLDSEYITNDKAWKKWLKKERQKDKRNPGRNAARSASPPPDCGNGGGGEAIDQSVPVERQVNNDRTTIDETATNGRDKDMDNQEYSSRDDFDGDDDGDADIDFASVVPAFIQSIVSQKDIVKKSKSRESVKVKDANRNAKLKSDAIFPDDTGGFTAVKKGTKQAPSTFCKTPEGFGNQALRVIREGNFQLAINYLGRAIKLDRTDSRHHINRSYCYLRVGEYEQALKDIRYASEHLSDILEMSRAKCREGQALCGLKDYDAAEIAFSESINLAPECLFSHRELKRMQIQRIVELGFKERDALFALGVKQSTREAINLLSEQSLTNAGSCDDDDGPSDEDDDDIFQSDTEEEPSNERILSSLLNYDPNMPEEPIIPEPPPKLIKEPEYSYNKNPVRAPSQERPLRIIKAVPVTTKPKNTNGAINEMAVWVGNLTPQMTDTVLQKRFSKFGKVSSVKRPMNDNYAFVNFQSSTSTQKALDEAAYNGGCVEINGARCVLKHATMKTFK